MTKIMDTVKKVMAWVLVIVCGLSILGVIFNFTYLNLFNKVLYICGLVIGCLYIKEH